MLKEFFGNDADDALQKAAAALCLRKEDIKCQAVFEVVPNTKHKAQVAVLVEVQQPEAAEPGALSEEEKEQQERGGADWVACWCRGVLKRMGFAAQVEVTSYGADTVVKIDLPDCGSDLNRGPWRALRGSLQHLVSRLATLGEDSAGSYIIDLCGTLADRKEKATYLASQIKKFMDGGGSWIGLHQVESQDRRLIHLSLKSLGLDSESRGFGLFRILEVSSRGKDGTRARKRKAPRKRRTGEV